MLVCLAPHEFFSCRIYRIMTRMITTLIYCTICTGAVALYNTVIGNSLVLVYYYITIYSI